MALTEYLTYAAAVWYIAYVVTKDDGPFKVFVLIRKHAPLGGLTTCMVCLSVWVGGFICLLYGYPIWDAFALAGIAMLVHGLTGWMYTTDGS